MKEVLIELRALEERLSQQNLDHERSSRALREVEVKISESSKELVLIQQQLSDQQEHIRNLENEIDEVQLRLNGERAVLYQQVRQSYFSGRQEKIKLLLNQEEPARLGRMVIYYDFLNRARIENINAVMSDVSRLEELVSTSRIALLELVVLEKSRELEISELENARQERHLLVARLENEIAESGRNIRDLRAEEEHLRQVVEEVRAALSGFPFDVEVDFGNVKGHLPWPVEGVATNKYGETRENSELVWNGIVLSASLGATVRAVHYGRIAFADWLPGLGLLVIVDHGEGYMSLYAHNETILKESGEWVMPGDAVAQVGNSGGQTQYSLYFEIRHEGRPINPTPWLSPAVQR